jgi:putative FmdB family regulatory protein
MPIYEYLCDSCGQPTEAMQKFSDAPLTDCERCGKSGALRKQVSLSSFSLKGSGWYATDYKKSSKPSDAKPADSAKPETKAETKSDSSAKGSE